jgi:hypothetical protein
MDNEDWLKDPLADIQQHSYKPRKLKNRNGEQSKWWQSFHFATRLKLDGADFFCRQALGAARMPDNLGLALLAHRQLKWYLEAFFFELMSAYDTLLQELNIIYAYDLKLKREDVRWDKIKDKLPERLTKHMEEEWQQEWFHKVRWYRNTATHHYLVPTETMQAGFGEEPLGYDEHHVDIAYLDDSGNSAREDIKVCVDYLKKMVSHVTSVWMEMAEKFS